MLLVSHKNLEDMKLLQCGLFKGCTAFYSEVSNFSPPVGPTDFALNPSLYVMSIVFSSSVISQFVQQSSCNLK